MHSLPSSVGKWVGGIELGKKGRLHDYTGRGAGSFRQFVALKYKSTGNFWIFGDEFRGGWVGIGSVFDDARLIDGQIKALPARPCERGSVSE